MREFMDVAREYGKRFGEPYKVSACEYHLNEWHIERMEEAIRTGKKCEYNFETEYGGERYNPNVIY